MAQEKVFQFTLHRGGQLQVARDTHRFRIIDAGRQWGKSVLTRRILLQWAIDKPGIYWLVSPTYVQGKMIHWDKFQQEIPQTWIKSVNHSELSITLKNGSKITLKSAENPDRLRGATLHGLVVDEIASIRNWDYLWEQALRATLSIYQAPVLFVSTPKGFNHFYKLYLRGQDATQEDYKSWQFTSYDNPHMQNDEVEKAKRTMSEDAFAQEYLADFRKATGLAHKPWQRAIHLIEPFDIPEHWQRARGFDYGSSNPTASVRVAVDPDYNWYVERCYLDSRRSIDEHARAILSQDYGLGIVPSWGDPSGAQWFREFERCNLYIEPADKTVKQGFRGWVEYGVEKVNQLLSPQVGHIVLLEDGRRFENAPRLFVFDTPENQTFVNQIELLQWRETVEGIPLPVLDESGDTSVPDGHFDLMAAFRYLVVSFSPVLPNVVNDYSQWAI